MGKTPTPLTILFTDPAMLDLPSVQELHAKGHIIGTWVDLFQKSLPVDALDMVIGPTCWRLPKELAQDPMYLDLAIKNARKAKLATKPPKPPKKEKGT